MLSEKKKNEISTAYGIIEISLSMIDICFKITHFLLLSNKLSRNSCGSHNCLIVSHSSVAPGVVLMSLGSKGFS